MIPSRAEVSITIKPSLSVATPNFVGRGPKALVRIGTLMNVTPGVGVAERSEGVGEGERELTVPDLPKTVR